MNSHSSMPAGEQVACGIIGFLYAKCDQIPLIARSSIGLNVLPLRPTSQRTFKQICYILADTSDDTEDQLRRSK